MPEKIKISYDRPVERILHSNRKVSVSGLHDKQEYQPVYDKKGVWHLEKTKKTNAYMEIQSHADSCDLNIIMQRYLRGEVDVLQQVQGFYGDVSNIPKNYADILNETIRGESLFRSLAPDVRAKFNNSVEQFVSSLGDGSAWEVLGVSDDKLKGRDTSVDVTQDVPGSSAKKEGAAVES